MRRIIAALLVVGTLALPAPTQAVSGTERVLIVGDSVTQGWRGDHTWRYFAWKQLEAADASVDFVGSATGPYGDGNWNYTDGDAYADPDFDQQHAAVGGGVLQYEGHRLQAWPVAQEIEVHAPDVVVSMWGINDLGDPDQSIDAIMGYYAGWIARARAVKPSIDFVVAELPQTWLYDGKVVAFNAALRSLAEGLATPASKIRVARMSAPYTRQDDFLDGIHPTTSGERKIAAMMVGALSPMLGPQSGVPVEPAPSPGPVLVQPTEAAVAAAVSAPREPRRVRAVRRGARIAVSWRAVRSAQRYIVKCGASRRSTSRSTISIRSTKRLCRVRSVNAGGASDWVRATQR